jgi:hypothetical protein
MSPFFLCHTGGRSCLFDTQPVPGQPRRLVPYLNLHQIKPLRATNPSPHTARLAQPLLLRTKCKKRSPLIAEVSQVNSVLWRLAMALQVGVFILVYVGAEAGMFYYVASILKG